MATVRPAAKARITMRLSDLPDGGCRVEMTEVAVSRPLAAVECLARQGAQGQGASMATRKCVASELITV